MPDDRSNVVAVRKLSRGARVECRIISLPNINPMLAPKYGTQWLLIKGSMVVEIGHLQAVALGMMEGQ